MTDPAQSDHTVGAHSDDRGGASDNPCYCTSTANNGAVPNPPDPAWRTQIRNILTDVIERRGVGEPEHYISDDDEQLHELLALLLTVQEQTEKELINLKSDIAYAIGHGKGCGHRITYLEKRYPELSKEAKDE